MRAAGFGAGLEGGSRLLRVRQPSKEVVAPLAIMTSDDTHDATAALLAALGGVSREMRETCERAAEDTEKTQAVQKLTWGRSLGIVIEKDGCGRIVWLAYRFNEER